MNSIHKKSLLTGLAGKEGLIIDAYLEMFLLWILVELVIDLCEVSLYNLNV